MCESNGKNGACYSRYCAYCRPQCAARHAKDPRQHGDLCDRLGAIMQSRDPKRGTGRTTQAVKAAALAAAFGKRVAYVCGTQHLANDACRIAQDFIARSNLPTCRISVARDTITFYWPDGSVAGILKFIGMDLERGVNLGLRSPHVYHIIRDHYCEELLAERARKAERIADKALIVELMKKHCIDRVYTTGGDIVFA